MAVIKQPAFAINRPDESRIKFGATVVWQRITTVTMKPEFQATNASYVIATRIGQVRSRVKLRSFGVRVFKSSIHGSEDAPN